MIRSCLGVVAFVVIAGCSMLLAAALAPGVPWWAWAFGVVFWSLLLLRRRRAGLDVGPGVEDGPQWSPTRGGGL